MANTNLSWGSDGMAKFISSLQEAVEESQTSYSSMQGQIESLIGPNWSGQAATTYQGAMQQWLDQFNAVKSALEDINGRMSGTHQINSNTHTETTAVSSRLQSTMSNTVPALPGF